MRGPYLDQYTKKLYGKLRSMAVDSQVETIRCSAYILSNWSRSESAVAGLEVICFTDWQVEAKRTLSSISGIMVDANLLLV